MNTTQEQTERLRSAGLRVTSPRLAILDALEQSRSHPSAEEIHSTLAGSFPSLSLSTVYVTLDAFIRKGLVRKLSEIDGRLRVDGCMSPHDHAHCRGCGKVFDIDRDYFPRSGPPRRLPHGLRLLDTRIAYEVLCPACIPDTLT